MIGVTSLLSGFITVLELLLWTNYNALLQRVKI